MCVGRRTCCPSFLTHDTSEQQPSSQSDSWQEILLPWQGDRPPPHWGVAPKGLFLSAKTGTLQEEKHLWPILPLGKHAINPVNVKKTWPSTMDHSLFFLVAFNCNLRLNEWEKWISVFWQLHSLQINHSLNCVFAVLSPFWHTLLFKATESANLDDQICLQGSHKPAQPFWIKLKS